MRMRIGIIASALLASLLGPMAIGALSGAGLNGAADGNQTRPFAESYYLDVMGGFDEYALKRNAFSDTGQNMFGLEVHARSACQQRLREGVSDDEILRSAALSYQRSSVLEQIFDSPAIEAIETLPAPIVGTLKGCRYTVIAAACNAWTEGRILRANEKRMAALQREREDWLRSNEAASCSAVPGIDAPSPKR